MQCIKNNGEWVLVMWDIKCAKSGCCGLSKGTQSDGLVSDTSTEEFTSGTSSENFKPGKISEKAVAKETIEVQNELENSIHSKPSSGLHQMRIKCQLYIRWGVLLSFGILLWVALWITDIFKSNPFLEENVATSKKVTSKTGMVREPALSARWFINLWSYVYNSIMSVTTLEILTFLCCVIILVYIEACTRNSWGGAIERLCYDQFYKSLLNTGAEHNETVKNNLDLNVLKEELEAKELEIRKCDVSPKFTHGDVRSILPQDETVVISRSSGKRTRYLNQGGRSLIENHISKSVGGSQNIGNSRKRSLPLNSSKNFFQKCNNQSREVVTSKLFPNEPKFETTRVSCTSKNDNTKLIAQQSNLTCSVFNKSTSFMSEEIETWFEFPDSVQVETVMRSFDTELEEFFETRKASSSLSLKETSQDLQQSNYRIVYECDEESRAVVPKIEYNGGIVSSSPAFRRFLMNLAKDRLSEPYL